MDQRAQELHLGSPQTRSWGGFQALGDNLTSSSRRPDASRSTPSLPWNVPRNQWQPLATDFACFRGFQEQSICHRLPPVATPGLHKGSIVCPGTW